MKASHALLLSLIALALYTSVARELRNELAKPPKEPQDSEDAQEEAKDDPCECDGEYSHRYTAGPMAVASRLAPPLPPGDVA
jgi:hypothetical protein